MSDRFTERKEINQYGSGRITLGKTTKPIQELAAGKGLVLVSMPSEEADSSIRTNKE